MYRNYFYREDLKVELTQLEEEDEKERLAVRPVYGAEAGEQIGSKAQGEEHVKAKADA